MKDAFLDKNGILNIAVVGDQDENSIRKLATTFKQQAAPLREQKKKVLVLSHLENIGSHSAQARKYATELLKELDYDRIAIVDSKSAMMKYFINFLIYCSGTHQKVQFFNNLDYARKWLLSYT